MIFGGLIRLSLKIRYYFSPGVRYKFLNNTVCGNEKKNRFTVETSTYFYNRLQGIENLHWKRLLSKYSAGKLAFFSSIIFFAVLYSAFIVIIIIFANKTFFAHVYL